MSRQISRQTAPLCGFDSTPDPTAIASSRTTAGDGDGRARPSARPSLPLPIDSTRRNAPFREAPSRRVTGPLTSATHPTHQPQGTTMTRPTTTPPALDHAATAAALDRVYEGLAVLDALLARSGAPSWQSPRIHALAAFGELHHLRDQLHTLAAGPGLASAYRTCATVAAPSSPVGEIVGPHFASTSTGDDDCGASVLNGLPKGATSAPEHAHCPRDPDASPEAGPEVEVLTGAHRAPQGHERIASQMDVQTQTDAKGAATASPGESASPGGSPIGAAG